MDFITELGKFYKHCLNVAGYVRFNSKTLRFDFPGPRWIGWMRCHVDAYLVDGKVVYHPTERFNTLKEALLYTIQDYRDYINVISGLGPRKANKKCDFLLNNIKGMNNNQLINMIEANSTLFPDIQETKHQLNIPEDFNDKCQMDD